LALCAAACSGGEENLGPLDAGSPAADAAEAMDQSVTDRTPPLDFDAAWSSDCRPRPPDSTGNEPRPPAEPCDPDAGAGEPPDTNDDVYGIDGCRPVPARLIVLGDSIAFVFGPNTPLVARLREWAPNVTWEGYAENGSQVASLPAQARRAAPGPGHVFVFIWSIGNDLLAGGILEPCADLSPYHAAFAEVFGYFGDRSQFPGGATFLLNAQYETKDGCGVPAAFPWRGPEVIERVLNLNKLFFLDVAEARPDTVAIDHYPDFLGHAANANIKGCPHCGQDNTQWTDFFGYHPNEAGRAHVGDKWAVAFAQMLAPSCPR
jgi:hypothetical protein